MRPEDIVVKNNKPERKEPPKNPVKTNKPSDKLSKVETTKEELKKKKVAHSNVLSKFLKVASRYQTLAITIFIVGLLAITALRMMHYANPITDDAKLQENLNKFKKIQVDQKTVERIKQLKESQTTTGSSVETGRTNPFDEP